MKMDIGDEIRIKKEAVNKFKFMYMFENGSLKEDHDNIDTLWRFIGELLKGEKI